MATLTIRNLPPRVIASLKRLAKANHRSMEQEARLILEEQASDRLATLEAIEASWAEAKQRPRPADIDRWVRDSRP